MSFRLLFTFPIDPLSPGGGSLHFLRLALEFAQAGAEVTVVAVRRQSYVNFSRSKSAKNSDHSQVLSTLHEAGIVIHLVKQNWLSWWFDGLAVRWKVARICRAKPPEVVLGWDSELAFLPRFLRARGISLAIIAAASYSLYWDRPGWRLRWLHRWMDERILARTARRADLVFANSAHTRSELITLLGVNPDRIRVIHPPLSQTLAKCSPRNEAGAIKRLIYFGRLTAAKGVYDLIEALGNLRGDPWELRIAGAGDRAAIEQALHERGIHERVTLLGHLDEERLSRHLQWAQLAVLPSYMESFGLSVAEAQLCGLPVIAYDTGPITEVTIPGQTGWIVPLGDIGALTESIGEALHRPEETRRRATAALQFASDAFLNQSPGQYILREICSIKGRSLPSVPAPGNAALANPITPTMRKS